MPATVLEDRGEIKCNWAGIRPAVELSQNLDSRAYRKRNFGYDFAPVSLSDLRALFSGQARLLALRAERGLPIDKRSVWNLLRVSVVLLRGEGAHD